MSGLMQGAHVRAWNVTTGEIVYRVLSRLGGRVVSWEVWVVFSPLYRVLKETFHFWEWRDNSNVQGFDLVFAIWIPSGWKSGDQDKTSSHCRFQDAGFQTLIQY